jgi:hypothetical protein
MGPDIPITAPEEERWEDQWRPVLGSVWRFFFWVRWRRQRVIRMARMAPKMAPGKKPARTALVGKEGHVDERGEVDVEFEEEDGGEETGVNVVPVVSAVVEVDVVEEFEDVAVLEVFVFNAQVLFPWHVYPKGQQALPHVGREASSLVVLTVLFGCAVTFCS